MPDLVRRRRRDADALSVDHLAHYAAGAVRGADQDLCLVETQVSESTRLEHFRRGDLLEASEQCVAPRIGPGQKYAQPAEERCEKRIEVARLRERHAEGRVHA